mgnify:CR=1 FL=1
MSKTDLAIPGERAVVTAAGSGIGREIARQLLQSGVDVVINDIDKAAVESALDDFSELDGTVRAVQGNARNSDDMEALIESAVDQFGGLDILVNNVGIAGPTKACEDITTEEFMTTLETNLGGHFNATRAAIPHLKRGSDGRIVNISSMSGKRPLANRTPYTTAKMGVIGFTRTLAVELASAGITVNAVCPGSVSGPRLEHVIEGQAESESRPYEEVEEEFRSVSPMNAFVEPSDVAQTVLYLCSTGANKVTGQDINVTAGVCMY